MCKTRTNIGNIDMNRINDFLKLSNECLNGKNEISQNIHCVGELRKPLENSLSVGSSLFKSRSNAGLNPKAIAFCPISMDFKRNTEISGADEFFLQALNRNANEFSPVNILLKSCVNISNRTNATSLNPKADVFRPFTKDFRQPLTLWTKRLISESKLDPNAAEFLPTNISFEFSANDTFPDISIFSDLDTTPNVNNNSTPNMSLLNSVENDIQEMHQQCNMEITHFSGGWEYGIFCFVFIIALRLTLALVCRSGEYGNQKQLHVLFKPLSQEISDTIMKSDVDSFVANTTSDLKSNFIPVYL